MSIRDRCRKWDFENGGYLHFLRGSDTDNVTVKELPMTIHVQSLFGEAVQLLPGSPEHAICHPRTCIEALLGSPEFEQSLCDDIQECALEFCRSEIAAEFLIHQDRVDEYCQLVAFDADAKAHIRSIGPSVKDEELLTKALDLIRIEEARIAANAALD